MSRDRGQSASGTIAAIQRQAAREGLKYGACRVGKDRRQLAIAAVLKYLADSNGKAHSFPTQETILDLVHKHHGITMSRRTLNRDLDDLRASGALQSYRRTKPHPAGGRRYTSTAYYITQAITRFVSAIRKSLRLLGLTRVPKLAPNEPCLRKETPIGRDPAVPAGSKIQRFAPPGQVPELIPG